MCYDVVTSSPAALPERSAPAAIAQAVRVAQAVRGVDSTPSASFAVGWVRSDCSARQRRSGSTQSASKTLPLPSFPFTGRESSAPEAMLTPQP